MHSPKGGGAEAELVELTEAEHVELDAEASPHVHSPKGHLSIAILRERWEIVGK